MKSTIKSYDFIEWFATANRPRSLRDDLARAMDAIGKQLALWRTRYTSRQELAWLSEDQLKDLGISGIDALQEARKPFWRP